MELIIAELSRYIIVILFALYTFYSYRAFIGRAAGNNEGVFRAQRVLIVMLHLVCSAVILVEEKEIKYVVLWALELFFFLFFTKKFGLFFFIFHTIPPLFIKTMTNIICKNIFSIPISPRITSC